MNKITDLKGFLSNNVVDCSRRGGDHAASKVGYPY